MLASGNQMFPLLLSLHLLVQFSSASGACVGGHRTGGKGALYLRVGLLHSADRVHPQGRAHAWRRLPGLWPWGTGTVIITYCSTIANWIKLTLKHNSILFFCHEVLVFTLLTRHKWSWKCHPKCAVRAAQQQWTGLWFRVAGWALRLPCQVEFLNDTSVITPAVLVGQLQPNMLYLVDFTVKQSAVTFDRLHRRVWEHLVVLRWGKPLFTLSKLPINNSLSLTYEFSERSYASYIWQSETWRWPCVIFLLKERAGYWDGMWQCFKPVGAQWLPHLVALFTLPLPFLDQRKLEPNSG